MTSKAPEFMSPNVWRKPEEKKSSSAEVIVASDSDDDCQIIAEKPGKTKQAGMYLWMS